MAFPGNTSTVVVLGTFITPEGDPSTGSVTFTASSWLTNSGANVSIPNSSVSKSLGTAGDFSVTLPITDDPDLSPLEFIYTVSEVVDGVSRNYNISIPGTVAAGGTVYLADLAPVAEAGPEYYSLASSLTIGTVTTLAEGASATADITGLAPSQVLDLGIPVGATGTVASAGSGSVGTAAIAAAGDPDTGIYFPAADQVAITTGGTERLRVTSVGSVGIGMTPVTSGAGSTPALSVTTAANDGIALFRGAADANGQQVLFHKTRNTTPTSHTATQADDQMGQIQFYGSDGSGWVRGAFIRAVVDGAVSANDVPGRVVIFTKPVGGSIAERFRLDSNGLITGTGTSLGAWTAYTPTLGGTGWAIGDGTASGAYCQIGKLVAFWAGIDFGSTSTFGASNAPEISLPVTAKSGSSNTVMGRSFNVAFRDGSLGDEYRGHCVSTTTNAILRYLSTNGNTEFITATAPFTWDASDFIFLSGTYEAA